VNDDLKGGFRDLRELNATARDGVSPLGYKSERRGKNRREEYWIPDATFEEVAGGQRRRPRSSASISSEDLS
jgi:hypothetical protein